MSLQSSEAAVHNNTGRSPLNHVLIVDDEQDSARMMAALIAAEQCTVATAHNLRDARRQMALQ
ncbi:hypothetical protein, partial [uncultured Azohydromonas sp.]|uniref:hypothetical protein n=1 Tax=uncultured Azohydromonas sp. TaxID=487342 RepID=UPI002607F586